MSWEEQNEQEGWLSRLERSDVLPMNIKRALDEVDKCMFGGAYAMAPVAARRGLEALCRDQGATTGTLEKRLEKLKADGKIDGRLLDWATHLRHIGNEGAHDLDFDPDHGEAADSQALFESMVRYVYIDQARYEDARKRWQLRKLPRVVMKYQIIKYQDGCHQLTIFRPDETLGPLDPAMTPINSWTYHVRPGGRALPNLGDLNNKLWKKCRDEAALWIQPHNLQVGEWIPAGALEISESWCSGKVHDDDEPPF